MRFEHVDELPLLVSHLIHTEKEYHDRGREDKGDNYKHWNTDFQKSIEK